MSAHEAAPGRGAGVDERRARRDEVLSASGLKLSRKWQTSPMTSRPPTRTEMPSVIHSTPQFEHNRAAIPHQPTRHRARRIRRFKSAAHLQHFASVHGVVQHLFRVGRHRLLNARSFRLWDVVTCVC